MSEMWQKLRDTSYKTKGIISLLVALITLMSMVVFVTQYFQKNTIQQQMLFVNEERSNQTTQQLELIYEQINSVSNLFFLDEDIEAILRTGIIYDYRQAAIDREKISQLQQKYNATVPKLDLHVTIISDDYRLYGDGSYDRSVALTIIEDQWWYQELLRSPWQTIWVKDEYLDELHGTDNGSYIYSIRFLKRFDTWENQGILIVSFLESDLFKLYANTVPSAGSVFVVTQSGELISMIDNAGVYSPELVVPFLSPYSANQQMTIDGVDYQIVSNTVRTPVWRVITVTPDHQLMLHFRGSTTILIALLALSFSVLVLFSKVVSVSMVKPIENFTNNVQAIGRSGDISKRIESKSKDEIGMLTTEFNTMMDRLEDLMASVVAEQEAKRSAELQSLYAQINPHFIYNTLASIRFLIISGDTKRAEEALRDFTGFLRNTISVNEEMITIKMEVALLQQYINIQELFFEEPFDVEWDIGNDIQYCKIIKLTMQPIVENAVLHGLKSKSGKKILSISANAQAGDILIRIHDNGIGTDMTLNMDEGPQQKSRSIGLPNVHERIKMHFGEPYGITFSSIPGQGTTVKILIPRIESGGEFL